MRLGAARSPPAGRRAPTGTAGGRRRCRRRAASGARRGVVAVMVIVAVLRASGRAGPGRRARTRPTPTTSSACAQVEPGIEPVGNDPLREQERHASEREHACRVGGGGDQSEQSGMPGRSARADHVGGDDRLPVAGRERVRRAPEDGEQERDEHDERAQMAPADERGEARVGDPVGRGERLAGEQHGRRVVGRRRGSPRPARRRAGSRAGPSDRPAARSRSSAWSLRRRSPSSRCGSRSCDRRRRRSHRPRRAAPRGSPGSVSCAARPLRAGGRGRCALREGCTGRPSTVIESAPIRIGTRCSVGISAMSTT